jgi:hypothetical protein
MAGEKLTIYLPWREIFTRPPRALMARRAREACFGRPRGRSGPSTGLGAARRGLARPRPLDPRPALASTEALPAKRRWSREGAADPIGPARSRAVGSCGCKITLAEGPAGSLKGGLGSRATDIAAPTERPFSTHCPEPREGLVTEPTPAVRSWSLERVFMPHSRPSRQRNRAPFCLSETP